MLLSVLIPSNRPQELNKLLRSAQFHSNIDLCEFIIVIDKDSVRPHETYGLDVKVIEADPGLRIGEYLEIAYKKSVGDFVLFCNDDVIVETPEWIHILSNVLSDKDTLYYLNDKLFESKLSCFPIMSREALDKTKFFPTPYHRYKIDDTIFYIFQKKQYLENVVFRHTNDHGTQGYQFPDGRIYGVEPVAAVKDQEIWDSTSFSRYKMWEALNGPHPTKVMIGLPTAEFARQAAFYDYFQLLDKPADAGISMAHGQSPAKSRNLIIDQAIQNGFSHIFFVDDDVLLPKDTITKLLAHNKDIVTGIYTQRNYPHRPFIFKEYDERGWACYDTLINKPGEGLVPIVAAGFGCILIKLSVFEHLERPYIRLGELDADNWCDDIGFFGRLQNKGLEMFADLSIRCGHMATVTLWPDYTNGQWITRYDTNGGTSASVPQVGL